MTHRLPALLLTALAFPAAAEQTGNPLSYEHYLDSDEPIKCLYGYYAGKTGDHQAAIALFEDCIRRWNSVYAMIGLARIYETGSGVERDLEYATALMKRGAETDDAAGYSALAKYHYGMALIEGRGTRQDRAAGLEWLRRAAAGGVDAARDFLIREGLPIP